MNKIIVFTSRVVFFSAMLSLPYTITMLYINSSIETALFFSLSIMPQVVFLNVIGCGFLYKKKLLFYTLTLFILGTIFYGSYQEVQTYKIKVNSLHSINLVKYDKTFSLDQVNTYYFDAGCFNTSIAITYFTYDANVNLAESLSQYPFSQQGSVAYISNTMSSFFRELEPLGPCPVENQWKLFHFSKNIELVLNPERCEGYLVSR